MKLTDHVEHIRELIDRAFRNRLGRMGITATALQPASNLPDEYHAERKRIEGIREVWIKETGTVAEAYEKLVEEFTFTLFNRIAALKVMEAHTLHPEIVTRRSQHGDRSFAHKHWLEQNADKRHEEMEGLASFMDDQLNTLAVDIPLFSLQHPYHLLPTAIELNTIMDAFNQVENDAQVDNDIWKSDDVLGWLYESYNNYKKAAHKDSGEKTEYHKVSLQSQVYTPHWVVKFLVDNSLGKLYLEMYPDSSIKERYKIANAPKERTRTPKPLTEIRIIDPATGSGNFLLYGFDLFYDLYTDQIDNYGADYDEQKIGELIITHNLHGVDLDDRAIQLAQLGLYIKAKRKRRTAKIDHFNIVSSDFYLPPYSEVKHLFESEEPLSPELEKIVTDLWGDLQQAYKFGALIRLEEKFSMRLHGLVEGYERTQLNIFTEQSLANYEKFRQEFFANLQKAVVQHANATGQTFLNTKTQDAISFLQLMTQKYDVAVANPPYTDSSDFGPTLKKFIDGNYKQPYKFNSNLYASFIKRCYELTYEDGYIAMIHPYTFMFIKSFEDVRKLIIENTHVEIFVDYGLDRVNLFDGGDASAPAFYVLSKNVSTQHSIFIKIVDGLQEKDKMKSFGSVFDNYLINQTHPRLYTISQAVLKEIQGWPFIYWISDKFREKFHAKSIGAINKVTTGLMTGNNEKFLRFHWEVEEDKISKYYPEDKKRWVPYQKGGDFNRWYGNNWLILDFENDGAELATTDNKMFYFKEGITYSALGKGVSFRYIEPKFSFDKGGACIFNTSKSTSIQYLLAFLNSKITSYIANCLNPTVNTQKGDIERIPFIKPHQIIEDNISALSEENVNIKTQLCSYSIVETNFAASPLLSDAAASLKERLLQYLNYENLQLTRVLLNEAIINQLVFEVYELSEEDREQVTVKMGRPIGDLPVIAAARTAYIAAANIEQQMVEQHIERLPVADMEEQKKQEILSEFPALYKSNNDLEEFCIRHQVNPINVWYWFRESKILPQARAADMALEFLADAFRTILMEDQDGIVPLVGLPGEPRLLDRFEEHCFAKGFTTAQIMQLDSLLGRPLNEYIEHYFFKNLSDHLNLFMHLPKTPFIWHLSSGEHQGFEAYVIIYKWNRDSLYRLKSSYMGKRTESLQYRLQQIGDSTTAQAQTEKETIRLQLQEITDFAAKVDELIAEGYNPKLDDGVGKNIAPLQHKGMLRAEVLKSAGKNSQLQKYLNADW